MNTTSLVVSFVALGISGLTAWLTLLRRGTVRMTQPTTIYFDADGGLPREDRLHTKVFLRTLLYSTSKRGRILQSLYIRLRRGESSQNFNIWVHGDRELSRGSGLFVDENGVAANHHFLPPLDDAPFQFSAAQYSVEVFATLVGKKQPIRLFSTRLDVTSELAAALRDPANGLYFDWGPDSNGYHPHIRGRPRLAPSAFLSELMG